MRGIQPDRERCYGIDVQQSSEPRIRRRNWARLGLLVAGAVVVALVALVLIRLALSTPHPALGERDAASLQLGSCLAETGGDLEVYTVVDCSSAHPQQVFGVVDMTDDSNIYTDFSAMNSYVDQVCKRYLEYGLFVKSGTTNDTYEAAAIAVPSEEEFDAGRHDAHCAIAARDGSDLGSDLYQAMP